MKYLLTVLVGILTLSAAYSAANAQVSDKTLICHATSSSSNPYNANEVDKNADVGGHDGHSNDIIPPFEYEENLQGGGTVIVQYPGKNWTAENEEIWNNGCESVSTSPTPSIEPSTTPEPSVEPTPDPTIIPSISPQPSAEPTPTIEPTATPIPSVYPSPKPKPDVSSANTCIINNYLSINSNTGKNSIKKTTQGVINLITGNATTNININNECGSNYAKIKLPKNKKIKFKIKGNGAGSTNIINYSSTSSIVISQ